jgi:hypothetical protein
MAEDVRLITTERNAVFKVVERSGLDPSEFEWKAEDLEEAGPGQFMVVSSKLSILVHKPTGFYYKFGTYGDEYSPGLNARIVRIDFGYRKWDVRGAALRQWLLELKTQYEALDLWQELLKERQLYELAVAPQLENTQFSIEEKNFVRKQLDDLRKEITSMHNLQLQQAAALENGFLYLSDSMERFGKRDWFNLAIGTLVNVAIAATLSPDVARDLLHRFLSAIQPLFNAALNLLS